MLSIVGEGFHRKNERFLFSQEPLPALNPIFGIEACVAGKLSNLICLRAFGNSVREHLVAIDFGQVGRTKGVRLPAILLAGMSADKLFSDDTFEA